MPERNVPNPRPRGSCDCYLSQLPYTASNSNRFPSHVYRWAVGSSSLFRFTVTTKLCSSLEVHGIVHDFVLN